VASHRRKSMVERCYEQVNELRGHRILGFVEGLSSGGAILKVSMGKSMRSGRLE
jgi:hypothetical protein